MIAVTIDQTFCFTFILKAWPRCSRVGLSHKKRVHFGVLYSHLERSWIDNSVKFVAQNSDGDKMMSLIEPQSFGLSVFIQVDETYYND